MNRNKQKFQKLLTQGSTIPKATKKFSFPNNSNIFHDKNLSYHLASRTQKMYSPFQHNFYQPPHLNSSKSSGLIRKGQCCEWEIRKVFNEKNYENQYAQYENRVKKLQTKKWKIGSKIKYLLDQDKPYKPSRIPYSSYEESIDE